jgi:DNA-binding NtrC family response regulator
MEILNIPLIFVVDDNPMYNRLIVSQLRLNKFQRVESFFSGEECLLNIYKKPTIIIQDYLMNGINGIEVLKESKKRDPRIEFIFLSSEDSFELAVNTIKYGASDYVVKDQLAFKKLILAINKVLKTQQITLPKKFFKMVFPFI